MRKPDNFDFLLLDDLGYLPQGAEESEVLCTPIAERYERRLLGITSNLVFSEWERVFANPMATAAAIDRVVHHSVILEFDVPSYRTGEAQQRSEAKEVDRQNQLTLNRQECLTRNMRFAESCRSAPKSGRKQRWVFSPGSEFLLHSFIGRLPPMSALAGWASDLISGSRVLTLLAAAVRALLLLVCLLPLVYLDTIYPAVVGKALYSRVLIECAFAGWLLLALCSPDCRPRKSWIMAALLAWLLVSLVSAMVGVSPTRSLWSSVQRMTGVVDLAHWTVYAVMVASMFRDRQSWGLLLLANVGASGVVAVWAVAPYFLSLTGIAEGGVGRVSGPFGNALSLGVYASVSAGLTVALMTLLRTRLWTPILGLVLVLNLSAVWISGTRSGLVALLVMFAVLAVSWAIYDGWRRLRVWIVAGALAGVLLLGGALAAWSAVAGSGSADMMVNRLASGFSGKNRSIEGRIQAGKVAVEATVARPVLGYGPENFVVAWGEFWPAEWRHRMVFDHAHNKFLEVSATTGLVGLAVYAVLWILLLLRAVKAARGRGEVTGMLGVAMLATLAGYLVMTMVMVDDAAFLLHFALLAGYLAYVETETARGMAHRWVVNLRSLYVGAAALLLGLGLSYCVAQYNVAIFRFAQVSPIPADIAEFVENERRLMDNFPALSNLRRFGMLITLAGPGHLDPAVMASVDADIRAGRSIDPTDWLLPVAATILYQRATSTGLDYLAESEYYLALLRQHSPQSSIIVELERRQLALATR